MHTAVPGVSRAGILRTGRILKPVVKRSSAAAIRSRRVPRRRRPTKLHADKGYDYDRLRRLLRQRGTAQPHRTAPHRTARKDLDSSSGWGAIIRASNGP